MTRRGDSSAAMLRALLSLSALLVLLGMAGCEDRGRSAAIPRDSVRRAAGREAGQDSAQRALPPSQGDSLPPASAPPQACAAVKDLEHSLPTIMLMRGTSAPVDTSCLRQLIALLADSAAATGRERYYDAFAALASIDDGAIGLYYDSLCAKLYHAATTSTLDYLYGRAIGRYSEMVSRTRHALAVEIDRAPDSAAAWRAFEVGLKEYASDDTTPRRHMNAELLRAGVLKQLTSERQ